ncbi:MAG: serine protease [Verrucomicrobiota bacterium JB024]|nr:serine protease [Verrucomicrobiota bacterium JB024]
MSDKVTPDKVKLVDPDAPRDPKGDPLPPYIRASYAPRQQNGGIGPFILALLIFAALLGGGYYYYFVYVPQEEARQKEANKPPPDPVTEESIRNNIVLIQDLAPDETYMTYQEGGTGFILEWHGKVFLVTNIHVLAATDSPHFLTLSGKEVKVDLDNVFLARNEDVAVVEISNYRDIFPEFVLPTDYESDTGSPEADSAPTDTEPTVAATSDGNTNGKDAATASPKPLHGYTFQPFEVLEDVEFNVEDGDKIYVYGNTLGKRIVQEKKGSIDGIGHNIFRHTASVKPGNSGSPIIHEKTGKVMGIVSYAVIYADGETEEEMYAFRLDNIAKWEHIGSWARFKHVNERVEAIAQRTLDLFYLSKGMADVEVYNDIKLRNILNTFKTRVADIQQGRTRQGTEMNESIRRACDHFLTSVENLLWEDIDEFLNANSKEWTYNYFRIQVLEQRKYREMIQRSIAVDRFHLQDF